MLTPFEIKTLSVLKSLCEVADDMASFTDDKDDELAALIKETNVLIDELSTRGK